MTNEYNDLIKLIRQCKICRDRFGFEPHPIVWGDINSKIVQISQAPSARVYESFRPFTDLSGKKLKYEWYQISDDIFYDPLNFYIVSLAHCYPGKDKNGNDRMPPKICYDKWVKKEMNFINNKLYIIIGAKAAKIFFPTENYNDLVFKNNYINNKLAIVLPHPSPLNIKWFKDHPLFMKRRIYEVRKIINNVLSGK